MIVLGKKIEHEYPKLKNERSKRTSINLHRKGLLYQYRNLASFWSIVQSDSFWATNARFSNDQEEQNLGVRKFYELLSEEGREKYKSALVGDCYIVCFCKCDDQLSQWRGYTFDGGISIGFDFSNFRPFSILHSDYESEKDKEKLAKKSVILYKGCYDVKYVDKESDIGYEFNLTGTNVFENDQHTIKNARNLIPYIKHTGFEEEHECRLVFENNQQELKKCIRYKMDNNIKIPYIIVKTGNLHMDNSPCNARVYVPDLTPEHAEELKRMLDAAIGKQYILCNYDGKSDKKASDRQCHGCTRRQFNDLDEDFKSSRCIYDVMPESDAFALYPDRNKFFPPHVNPKMNNDIIISQGSNQEEIFEKVYDLLQEFNKMLKEEQHIKVWCEGHLPIRTITVGPCRNKGEIAESIEHYCKNTYWLRCVDVKISIIPYRKSLK